MHAEESGNENRAYTPALDVLYLIPPYFSPEDFTLGDRATVYPQFTIPYGILSLDSYLKEHSPFPVRTDILDLNITLKNLIETGSVSWYLQEFERLISQSMSLHNPRIVAISALFNSSSVYLEQLAGMVKQCGPNSLVVAGGGLPSAAYKIILANCPSIDAVCKGEGEKPLLDLVSSHDPRAVLTGHKSLVTFSDAAAGKIPQHDFIDNLDEIPMLDYSSIDLNCYNSRSIDKQYSRDPSKREMSIHTSRGCPFFCVFCSNPSLHGRDVRLMSVDRVVAEVQRMKDDFGMNVLFIEDDHFMHDRNRALEILRRLANLNIRVEFPNGLAVYAIDDEMAMALKGANVSAVALAVESGSAHVLNKIIKKPLKKRMIKPAVAALRRHGVKAHVFIVAGLPGEMDEHRTETREMLVESGFDWVHVFCAIPIYGSRLYDICVENGYINTSDSSQSDFVATRSVITAPGVDPKAIAQWAYETQIAVNFLENFNMRSGSYEVALTYFENVVEKYPDHLLGLLKTAEALQLLGRDPDRVESLLRRSRQVHGESPEWQSFIRGNWASIGGFIEDQLEYC